ncbi:MAG: response regulator [Spirochaetes bacterium]|nr:response regulator [Spirochaetota bacterium]
MNQKKKDSIKILVVDDKPRNLMALRELLMPIMEEEECQLLEAQSGTEALKVLLDTDDIALILMDIQMPGIDGITTAQIVKTRKKSADIPIIFITAHSPSDSDNFKSLEIGAFDLITKPFNPQLLMSKTAVFIRLHKALQEREKMILQEKEVEKNRRKELEAALERQKKMSTRDYGSISAYMSGIGIFADRLPAVFQTMTQEYRELLNTYLKIILTNKLPLKREIIDFAERLGEQACGPKDLMDIHVKAVEQLSKGQNIKRITALNIEGRLFVLEVMGNLVDYYRKGRFLKYKFE